MRVARLSLNPEKINAMGSDAPNNDSPKNDSNSEAQLGQEHENCEGSLECGGSGEYKGDNDIEMNQRIQDQSAMKVLKIMENYYL